MVRLLLIMFIFFTSLIHAAGEPLNVGIETFDPPFVIQGAHQEAYGFDIEMMNELCKAINRTCQFHVMPFDQLLTSVANKTIDVAVSSITITAERSKIVNFSLPYLLSYSRFLQKQSAPNVPFNLDLLNSKKIGIEKGTIFSDQLISMGVKNPNVTEYDSPEDMLKGLSHGDVDFILVDNATAVYWASNSSDVFKLVSKPYMYGFGYGIAINPSESGLLTAINQALVQYQNTDKYKQNYDRYLLEF